VPDVPALVIYTSGTTGPPKGAVLPRSAVAYDLDALAEAWDWTADDLLVHALPLFHVHGLVLGVLGPLRRGGSLHHIGRLDAPALAAAGASMVFGVPTQYHRLADQLESDPESAKEIGRARLLVSGSAALTAVDHARIHRATGLAVRERYGLTETLILTAARAAEEPEVGTVGRPLRGTEIRLAPLAGPAARADNRAEAMTGWVPWRCAVRACSPATSTAPTPPRPRTPRTAGSPPVTSAAGPRAVRSRSSGAARPT
jgi:malonyl-CoA/methylmalonyl-CoA synthetase